MSCTYHTLNDRRSLTSAGYRGVDIVLVALVFIHWRVGRNRASIIVQHHARMSRTLQRALAAEPTMERQ